MKLPFLVLFFIYTNGTCAQTDTLSQVEQLNSGYYEEIDEKHDEFASLYKEVSLRRHRKTIKLNLTVDSLIIAKKSFPLKKQWSERIRFETDYLHLHENVFIKIFVARNQEYDRKFYSWSWHYYRKEGSNYRKVGNGFYCPISYKSDYYSNVKGMGQGIGTEGTDDFIMVYYRYKVE